MNKNDQQGASTVDTEETAPKNVTQFLNEAKQKNLFSMRNREWKNKWNNRNLRISPVEQKRRRCNRNVFEDFIFLESDCRYNNDDEGVDMDELVGFSFVQFCRLLDTTDYKVVGHSSTQCTVIHATIAEDNNDDVSEIFIQCFHTDTFSTKKHKSFQVTSSGVYDEAAFAADGFAEFAITGGTTFAAGATGQMTIFMDDKNPNFIFHHHSINVPKRKRLRNAF
eukprot:scaffold106040_cov42-Attheya_sp.AAC.1